MAEGTGILGTIDTHAMIVGTGMKAIIDVIAMMTGFVIHLVASARAHQDVVVTNVGALPLPEGIMKKEWTWTIGGMAIALATKMVVLRIAEAEMRIVLPIVLLIVPLLKDGKNQGSKMRTVVGGENKGIHG